MFSKQILSFPSTLRGFSRLLYKLQFNSECFANMQLELQLENLRGFDHFLNIPFVSL